MKYILFCLVFLSGPLSASTIDLAFADSLYAHHEYYRAISEYYKGLYFGDEQTRNYCHSQIRFAYLASEDFTGLTEYLGDNRIKSDFPFEAWALIRKGRPDLAAILSSDNKNTDYIMMYAISNAYSGKFEDAQQVIQNMGSDQTALTDSLSQIIANCQNLSYKEPVLAGILSVIPGSGYAYNGSWHTAMSSLTVNILWMCIVNELVHKKLYYSSYGITVIGLGFYIGNIYGAANESSKQNRKKRTMFLTNHLKPIIESDFLLFKK
jgi:hypothetical protein